MSERYEYLICQVQSACVTFVNGEWAGSVSPSTGDHEAAFASCPLVWDYLQQVGADGWELVGAYGLQNPSDHLEKLYLKRAF